MFTFLFTDIEGSTGLWQRYPDRMGQALARHDALLDQAIAAHAGKVVKRTGDGVFAVFEAGEPLACALAIQQAAAGLDWGLPDAPRLRIALHCGAAIEQEGDYLGLDVNRTARLLNAGWGGQILLTCEMARQAGLPPGAGLLDLGIHTLKDLSEPQHIFQFVHPDLAQSEFPALRTLSAHPHNLPSQPTPFIGRSAELAEISALLGDPACRLLTLLGPGGIGKTRLALQAAAGLVEAFPHGVYFVSLAPLSASDQIIPAIAAALKLNFYAREAPATQLFNYLGEKTLLLVLDNFEHLIDSAGLVAEILSTAPQVKALVTSRERLNLRQESVLTIEGMRLPQAGQDANLETFSAARLFLQSARRVRPDFTLSAQESACVARICRLVEGVPLCLELAAGWLRALSCQEIAAELETSLDFLETNRRDAPQRHRSLRAVFEYSWALLDESEQRLLARLAVFQGAFSRPAAEALTGSGRQALLAALTGLGDKSLLRRNSAGDYELHNLMRQYALEHLQTSPAELAQTRGRHASYFIALIAGRRADLDGNTPKAALDQVAGAFDDLRAAWLWALEQGDQGAVAAALPAMFTFLNVSGRTAEGERLFGAALAALEQSQPGQAETGKAGPAQAALLLRLRIHYAAFCRDLHRDEQAEALLLAGLAEAQATPGMRAEVAQAATWLGEIATRRGDYAKAIAYDLTALEIYQELSEPRQTSRILDHLGVVAWTMGDLSGAQAYFEQALHLARQHGAPLDVALCLDHMGVACRDQGRYADAQQYFIESVAVIEPLEARHQLAFGYNHLAGSFVQLGQGEQAIQYYEKSNALASETGDRRIVAYNLLDLSGLLQSQPGGLPRAAQALQESLAIFEALKEPFGSVLAQADLARITFELGERKAAWRLLLKSLRIALQLQNNRATAHVMATCAMLYAQEQDWQRALALLTMIPADLGAQYELQRNLAEFRQRLSEAEYRQALAQGEQLTLLEALAWVEAESWRAED
jgi:predicted ATPase/class 3 adenylate cyclase